MDAIKKRQIMDNIFYKSRYIVDDFDDKKWHTNKNGKIDADSPKSSQALVIDVFGYLRICRDRDSIINNVFNVNGHDWCIELEFSDKSLLNETSKSPTQIDIKIEDEKHILIVECKFTEEDGGSCFQTSNDNSKKQAQCNGNYELQINPVNKKESFCALTGKGINYWQHIEKIYNLDINNSICPCPFKAGNYQWMRNLCIANALNEKHNKNAKVFICYTDFVGLEMKKKMDNGYLQKINSIVKEEYRISTITYQKIVEYGCNYSVENDVWRELKIWIDNKWHKING